MNTPNTPISKAKSWLFDVEYPYATWINRILTGVALIPAGIALILFWKPILTILTGLIVTILFVLASITAFFELLADHLHQFGGIVRASGVGQHVLGGVEPVGILMAPENIHRVAADAVAPLSKR